ncbi:unnamed protein product [Lepeophtheirus salmonis]|uniref:(salmon louse) hypothetical protein n=1 Tax=Lepeophtheirus salmonis TaxID=72036 RepID=A0A7R8H7P3_LEPSM|nr:unnamed protein product [Lepeophtheirus salmonis]CAF2905445.1 unnamed protein product [Lepeophtheirus salmonis]
MTEGIEQEHCPKCEKVVYDAEGFPAGGKRFHKKCFKCKTCDRKLDSTSVRCHEGFIYCRPCHLKVLPNESPKIYLDTSLIQPEDGKGCPRCGGIVYEAEKVTVKDDVYHKHCFNCKRCTRAIDSLISCVAPDGDIYCKVCYKVVTRPDRPQIITDTGMIPADEDKVGCPRCNGKVFEAEKMNAKTGSYHRRCFTCFHCKRPLDYQLCAHGPDDEIYCRNCYAFTHGHKAKPNLNTADVEVIQGSGEELNVCPRCNGLVFEAEKQIAKDGTYHKKCFNCFKCKHQMDPSNFINGPDKEVYCTHCYGVTHGHKAITKSMPLDTTSIMGEPGCEGKVFAAEKMIAASGWYHRHCFRCFVCCVPLDSTSVCDGPDSKIYCRVCYGRVRGSSKPLYFDESKIFTTTIPSDDSSNPCPRCGGKVFAAEMIMSMQNVYHMKCFTCKECLRPLDKFSGCDAPGGEVVCRTCYDRLFSCSAYTLSGGDMLKLLDPSIIKGSPSDENTCPRCSGKVFHAEKISVKGKLYHKKCSTCLNCTKPLVQSDIFVGKDEDIYCKACYSRKFGAPGYRGAGCGDWTDHDSAKTVRPVQDNDVSIIKGNSGDTDTCLRCNGKIFETERKASKNHYWHKKCFNCAKCHKSFTGTLEYVFEGSNDEIYCKTCLKKTFPENETPLVYSDTTLIKSENGCPRCEGSVFQAEEVNIKGRMYHKKCLSCRNCHRPVDISLLDIGPDDDIYCKICCKKISWPGRYSGIENTAVIPGEDGEPTNCPRCNGKVFEAEKMNTKRGLYHKRCFNCIKCKNQLDYFKAIEGPDDEVYCRVCYLRHHGPGGKNMYGDKTHVDAVGEENLQSCGRCKGKVFETEKIATKGGWFHKFCLSCNECKANMDASSFFNGSDEEVYCRHCYAVKFGHKKKSDYKGWMDVQAIAGDAGDKNSCIRCKGKVFEAERMVTRIGSYHRNCYSCIDCSKKLDSVTCCEGPDMEIYCKSCYSFEYGTRCRTKNKARHLSFRPRNTHKQEDTLARSTVETWVIKAEKGDQDWCPKCEGKVFEAEKMTSAAGLWYHRNCFRCVECTRLLDSLVACDGPDYSIYCNKCYSVKYGPQIRPAADIDVKLLDLTSLKNEDPEKNCPRCGGDVFKVEAVNTKNRSYHKKCATCASCAKQLESSTTCLGQDKEIYCKGCNSRKFASAGFRGTGCSTWVDNEAGNTLRHSFQAFLRL